MKKYSIIKIKLNVFKIMKFFKSLALILIKYFFSFLTFFDYIENIKYFKVNWTYLTFWYILMHLMFHYCSLSTIFICLQFLFDVYTTSNNVILRETLLRTSDLNQNRITAKKATKMLTAITNWNIINSKLYACTKIQSPLQSIRKYPTTIKMV